MKHLLLSLAFLVSVLSNASGQAVTTNPAFPNPDADLTITIDLKQAKSSSAGLLGKTDIFLWAWGGTDLRNLKAEFGPAGQNNFNMAFEPGKMTPLGNDVWSIKLKPAAYLPVPAGKKLAWMGLLAKNTNGSAQTEDFIINMFDGKLNVSFIRPALPNFFVDANAKISLLARSSSAATLAVSLDGVPVSNVTNRDSISLEINVGSTRGVKRTVRATATTATETATTEFSFTIKPEPVVAALPTGIKDGINYLSDSRVVLSLFAPNKSFVYAVGEFNDFATNPSSLMRRTPDGNRYWLEINNLVPRQEYAFQYLVDGIIGVGDPYAELILDRNNDKGIPATANTNIKPFPERATGDIVSVLQTAQTPYPWKVTNFKRPANEDLVIYELLVRDFIATQSYKTLADSLGYLKRMGINCLELMPIMEFTNNDSWGYNPIYYQAVDKAYGTRNDLKALIDKCHQNGMSVVLDMVLNQADYEFPYVKMYWNGSQPSKDSPMFNETATHPFNVFFDFNHESQATRDYVDRVCEFWIKEFKFDGYRFDLSKGFTQVNSGNDVSRWGNYDASRVAIWKRIYDKIRTYDATAHVILEHFGGMQEEKELSDYGMLFWSNSNGDFRNAVRGGSGSFQWLSYKSHTFTKPAAIGFMESHDEERVMFDALNKGLQGNNGTYNVRDLPNAMNRAKAAAAFMLAVPGPKLIWQFGELGYDVSIDQNGRTGRKPIKWEYARDPERAKLYKVYAELIKLKLNNPAFRSADFELVTGNRFKTITIDHPSMKVHLVGNFDTDDMLEVPKFPNTGRWFDFFTGQEVNYANANELMALKAGEFHIYTTTKMATPEANLVPWAAYTKGVILGNAATASSQFTVSPNPAEGDINWQLDDAYTGVVQVQIRDVLGRSINHQILQKDQEILRSTVVLQNASPGLYIIEATMGQRRLVRKVLKK